MTSDSTGVEKETNDVMTEVGALREQTQRLQEDQQDDLDDENAAASWIVTIGKAILSLIR